MTLTMMYGYVDENMNNDNETKPPDRKLAFTFSRILFKLITSFKSMGKKKGREKS